MRRIKRNTRLKRFIKDISIHTPFTKMIVLLIGLWLAFSTGLYFAERGIEEAKITSFGDAMYWGIAAFSTAGIADAPQSDIAKLVGGTWIVVGSVIFFGTIVATVTTYFMRPLQRPSKRISDTIEYNLEQLNDLTIDELDIVKETVDTLITHVEHLKKKQLKKKSHNNHGGKSGP